MNEFILELAAMLLSLFCLIYSTTARRELYVPLPGGVVGSLKSQHSVYLAMLVSVVFSAATSVAAALGQIYTDWRNTLVFLDAAYFFIHNTLPFLFALYVLNLCGPARKQRGWFFAVFALPLAAAEALLLSNPFTHVCFTIDSAMMYHRGPGLWLLYAVAGLYLVMGLTYFMRFGRELSRTDYLAALMLIAVCIVGAAVQAAWAVPVELFFEAVAFFGFMAMLEHDDDASPSGMSSRFRGSAIIAITVTFLAVIVMNVSLILSQTGVQSDQLGNIRLDVIRDDLQDTLSEAEKRLLRVSLGAEQILDAGGSREALERYFRAQKESLLADERFMNVYIAGADWHIVPDFDAPPDFHAAERIWYVGAMDRPGEIYISEPYVDVTSGAMCFTIATALQDGGAVAAIDLNFSKVQESIQRMTNGTGQTAMIVTANGLIVGYTDMSLVGERASEKLPEYAEVLQRVASSQTHDSFRIRLNGRSHIVFSAETSNDWYLILDADARALYAESYRQMAMMAAVNLLMLVLVVIFYLIGKRNRIHTAEALQENERVIGALAEKLRQSATRLLRLSDASAMGEGMDAAAMAGDVRSSGFELSKLADNMRAYSGMLGEQREKAERQRSKKRYDSASAPSRSARNGIVITLLIAMAIAMLLSMRSTASWGNTRMRREADHYENVLNEWVAQQQSILFMFTDMIASQPELLSDYDAAVRWLNDVAVKYPEISACYLANPYAEHAVIMNNGWTPGADYALKSRPWYRETERDPKGFSISTPYLDEQTGGYCVTFSRVVYGENNEFLGVFGIDFFLDKLTGILGERNSGADYTFLLDANHTIINHPNPDYQIHNDVGTSVEDTEYAEAYHRKDVTVLRDYAGRLCACVSREAESGFTLLLVSGWWSVYGAVVLVALAFLLVFAACVGVVVMLINRLIRWQEETNRQLTEAAEAAVSAGRAKSQFLAQMSHEIRTPMNAIIGLDNIALRDPDVPPRTREQLEKIDASARHLLSLINDILDMSRIESGRMVLKEERFCFRDFLDQISVIINGQCADKGLAFECRTLGTLDEYLVGDDLKLKQVLINILGNSVKFTDPPGRVTFTVEQTASDDESCCLRFTMEDTGIGMDAAFIPKLFEAFSQEDATTTNRYGGSGLGMAITRNIVEMMGGEIGVESEKGRGSIFTVSVPLKRASGDENSAPAGAAEEAAESVSLSGLHVLIAEDIELNAEVLTDLLEMEDITSEWAENGQLAVERFDQSPVNHFGAVLMDMRMPVMDGLTAARELRKLDRPDARTVPIIALTANAFEEDVQTCLQAGMDAHLSKPVDIEKLKALLGKLIHR